MCSDLLIRIFFETFYTNNFPINNLMSLEISGDPQLALLTYSVISTINYLTTTYPIFAYYYFSGVDAWCRPHSGLTPGLTPDQWRNVAMRKGRQNFEFKLFGCKYVPYVGHINVRWWGENIWGYKKLQGAPKTCKGRKKAYKKNRKNSGDLFLFLFFRRQ